jgi:hypothetical protein
VNDLFIKDDAGGHTGTDVYNALNANVTQNMWCGTTNAAAVATVITTKLDGSAASISHNTGSPAKWKGQTGAVNGILGAACVVTLRTGFRGRSRRGRIYLPWIDEAAQNDGVITPAAVTSSQTAWDTFVAAMVAAGYPLHVCSRLHDDSVQMVSVTVQGNVKSQRRRNRR